MPEKSLLQLVNRCGAWRLMLGMLLGATLGFAPAASADRCCYAVCGSRLPDGHAGPPVALLVVCSEGLEDCPRSVGGCMVWAHKDKGVRCDAEPTCPVGLHDGRDGEALAERLAADDDLVVTRRMRFRLRSGAVEFRPR